MVLCELLSAKVSHESLTVFAILKTSIGQMRHKVLSGEDLSIHTQNERLQKAQDRQTGAHERLAGLQEGTSVYAKAKKALQRAELSYKRATEISVAKVGSGSGKVSVLLAKSRRPVLSPMEPSENHAIASTSAVPQNCDNGVDDWGNIQGTEETVAEEPEQQGRGKRMRFNNTLYASNYNMHRDSESSGED